MKHVIIRTGVGCYRYLVDSMRKKARSASISLTKSNFEQYKDKLAYKPMFTPYYMVEAIYATDSKYSDYIVKTLASSPWIQLVVYVDKREDFESLQGSMRHLDVLFFDSYSVDDSYMIKYIQKHVWEISGHTKKLSFDTAKYIRRRVKFQDYLLDSKLELLCHTDFSKQDIRKIIPAYRGVKVSTFPLHFFKGDHKGEIASFLVRYQRSIDYLYKPTLEFVQTWLTLYEKYLSGEISPVNYTQWMLINGESFGIRYTYQMDNWMSLFSMYSYDLVLLIFSQLYSHRNDTSYLKTLVLYKLLRGLPNGNT